MKGRIGLGLCAVVLAAGLLTSAGGCLVTSSSRETHSGDYVSVNTFNQIKPGSTTEGWVRATLGEPSSKSTLDNGHVLWRYQYVEHTDSSGTVFLLFAGSGSKETKQAAFVEFKDGVVVNAWRS